MRQLNLDLLVERRRIPIVLVFDDLPADDLHETASLDTKRLHGAPNDPPRKVPDMTHSLATASPVTAPQVISILKSGKVTNVPSKKALIASRPRNTLFKATSQYSACSAKKTQKQGCIVRAPGRRPPCNQGVLAARNTRLAHQSTPQSFPEDRSDVTTVRQSHCAGRTQERRLLIFNYMSIVTVYLLLDGIDVERS